MFKNAIAYRIKSAIDLSNLQAQLGTLQSREPGAIEARTQGFVAPDKERPDELARKVGKAIFIRLKTIEKILPASVINDYLEKEIEEMESVQQRKIKSKERRELKNEVILGLLPDAFTKPSYTDAFIDPDKNLIVVNASSFKKAEDVLTMLRKAMGSFPVMPINVINSPKSIMTRWSRTPGIMPAEFVQEGKYTLVSEDSEAKKARFSEFDSSEIEELLDNGAQVVSMSLGTPDLAFTIDDDLRIKSIRDVREVDVEHDENENPYEADCLIAHGLITKLVDELIEAFGGEKE
jgi:recombination associated protein RdgC